MLMKNVRPTSIVGVLRLAKQLQKQFGGTLSQAQNEAAVRAGFQNYMHAQHVLGQDPHPETVKPRHRVFISAYWADRDTSRSGREVWWADLSAPYGDLVTLAQMREQRAMVRLEPRARDHLVMGYKFDSQERARRYICHALRTFQFIDATKLRPSAAHSRLYPGGSSENAIPGQDHETGWYDPVSKGHVLVDEPYELAALSDANERILWAEKHGFDVVKSDWRGMYKPLELNGSCMYLIASKKNGPPLLPLAQALSKLPPPIIEGNWAGESVHGHSPFISPASR